jgi:hypothetical protein
VDVAASGAEALRSLCHITQSADSFEYAQDIYLTIGQLDELSSLLRQAIDQTRRALQRRAVQGDVYDDRGVDPTETVRRCTEAMRDAEAHTTAVAVPLSHAKELASHLGGGRRPTRGLE